MTTTPLKIPFRNYQDLQNAVNTTFLDKVFDTLDLGVFPTPETFWTIGWHPALDSVAMRIHIKGELSMTVVVRPGRVQTEYRVEIDGEDPETTRVDPAHAVPHLLANHLEKMVTEYRKKTKDKTSSVAGRQVRAEQLTITGAQKRRYAQIAQRLGLDGNGRFRSIGAAINRVWDALSELGDFQIDDVPSADLFRGPQGHRALRISRKTDDPFTNIDVTNSRVVISWTETQPDRFDVVSYLS